MLKCFDLTGKTALVTGASQGLGKEFAKALAQSGANLSILSRTQSKLEQACEELKSCGVDCIWNAADITDELAVRRAVEKTVEHYGKIDILIDNAAAPCIVKNVEELTIDEWNSVMDQNVNGMFIVAKEVAKQMIPRRSGKIVLLASIASEIFNNTSMPGVYETSKGAVRSMVRVLSANWCRYNINVNAIAPGYFMSDVIEDFFKKYPERYESSVALVPCGRYGQPEELGPLAVFLSSDSASYMHGTVVTVDGGRTYM